MVEGDLGGNIDCFILELTAEESNRHDYYRDGRYSDTIPEPWRWSDHYEIPSPISKITVVFDENARLHFTTDYSVNNTRFPFNVFIEKTLQRIEALCTDFSCGDQLIEDWDGLLSRSFSVSTEEITDSETPFSIRQISVSKSGKIHWIVSGAIRYSGDLTEYFPYIDVGSILHIGKG